MGYFSVPTSKHYTSKRNVYSKFQLILDLVISVGEDTRKKDRLIYSHQLLRPLLTKQQMRYFAVPELHIMTLFLFGLSMLSI